MEARNQTVVSEFLLLGLTADPAMQPFLLSLFVFVYLATILGNLLIILTVSSDSHLHTPMYFFLSNLPFTDICISTTTIPKMLLNIQTQTQSITYTGCLLQVCFVLIFGGLENCLLTVMAFDRYVAICYPLRYTVILTPYLCVLLIIISLLVTNMQALLHSLMLLRLSFCTDMEIPHFCELVHVIGFSCSDTLINNILIYLVATLFVGIPVVGIIFSYTQIFTSILKIPSVRGRYKAFSTCGSHLTVVSLFYDTAFVVYMSSAVTYSSTKNVVSSVMYIVLPQMLNPIIYNLSNREIKRALRHLIIEIPFL